MSRRDAVVAGVILLLAALAAWQAARLPYGGLHTPGPGFLPWWASCLVGGLALVLAGQALVAVRRGAEASAGTTALRGVGRVALLVAVIALYVAALEALGYPLGTFLLVVFMLRVPEPQGWTITIVMAALTAGVSYVLFAVWLGVPLPPGPFGR